MDIFSKPRGVLSVLFISISIVLAYLLIPFKFSFPSLGFSALFITIACLAYLAKKRKSTFDSVVLVAIVALSLFLVLRANAFLNFLDVLTILFLGSYFLSLPKGIKSLVFLMISPFVALGRIIQAKNLFPYDSLSFTPDFLKKLRIGQHLPSILVTVILLLVVIPLLSYANPFFQKIVNDVIKALDLTWVFKSITDHFLINILRLLIAALLMFFLPRGVSQQRELGSTKNQPEKTAFRINLLIPKIVLSFVLIVFFITQLQLYLSSPETLKNLGYTNSQYAREVFGQLSVVAFIIFALMYADRSRNKFSKYLTTLLIVQGVFLCSIALKSVMDYTGQYGFTSKRLYGYAGATWIFGLFVLFGYHYYKNEFEGRFVKHVVLLSTFVVLCINLANFDYLIYHRAKPQVFGTDYEYLAGLSPDADSYNELVTKLERVTRDEKDVTKKRSYVNGLYRTVFRINYLQNKYKAGVPAGSFNWSEYRAYNKIKNVNTQKIQDYLNSLPPENVMPLPVTPSPSVSTTPIQTSSTNL